jgi:putative endonuclease
MSWSVYVLVSASRNATYVGVTTDMQRRLAQHNGELPGGARNTRRDRPWTLGVVHGSFDERAEAQRVEAAVKRRRGLDRLRAPDA